MAQEIEFGTGGEGKIRSFWVGLGLTIVTFGIYHFCWYYFLNDEQKDVGIAKGDQNLSQSSPTNSVIAVLVGGWLIVPPLISVYNFGLRIRRTQRLVGIPRERQINPINAFLLLFPGGLLIVPLFFHYWYVTKHQNASLRAMGGIDPSNAFADYPVNVPAPTT
jgi:hypothetical protein